MRPWRVEILCDLAANSFQSCCYKDWRQPNGKWFVGRLLQITKRVGKDRRLGLRSINLNFAFFLFLLNLFISMYLFIRKAVTEREGEGELPSVGSLS